jgi:autotransporter-associated beta strand protein
MKNKRLFLLPATIAAGFNLLAPSLHAAAITWDAGGANNNWSTINNWSDNAAATGDDVTFNATGALASGTTNTVDASISIASLAYSQETNQHTTAIGANQTLTVAGNFLLASSATVTTTPPVPNTNVTLTGATGTLTVGNSTNSTFQVGQTTPTAGTNTNSLDMSGLGTFNANLGVSGIFRLGSSVGTGTVGALTTVKLAATSSITADILGIGDKASRGGAQTLKLGSTSNTINANNIYVGPNAGGGRANGDISFETGTGTLKLRAADGSAAVNAMNLINTSFGTSNNLTATANFAGHSVDAMIGTLVMGRRNGGTNATATATFTFDTGTLVVGTLNLGENAAASSTAGAILATMNVGGGIASFDGITMATSTGGALTTTSGVLNFTGGTTTVSGNITRGGGNGTTATLALNGASAVLDMTGKNLTSLTGITYTNGLLKNLGIVNTGMTLAGTGSRVFDQGSGISGEIQGAIAGTGLSLTKQGAGTLTLSGGNTYDGTTQVDGGFLVFRNTGAKAAGLVTAGAAGSIGLGVGAVSGDYTSANVAALFTNTLTGFSLNSSSAVGIDTTAGSFDQATALTSARNLTKLGTNTLTLSQANTYTGVTTLSAGAINLGVAENVGVSGPLGNSASANPGSIVLSGGTLQYSAANTHDYSGRFSTAANQIYSVNTNSQNVIWASNLASSGGTLAKLGAGSLTLSGNNTFTGNVTISTGELKITNANALGTGPKTINAQNLGYLSLDGSSGNIALTSNLSITTAGLSILNLVGDNVINGTVKTIAGNGTSTITSDGGSLTLAGNVDSGATGNRTLELSGISTDANTIGGAISNGTATTLAITKSGAGTWTLTSDTNTYTGATNVTNGKLVVNGNISTSSLTTIASGATLAGSGTVGKTIVNGTLAVGNSPGKMDFTDTLGLAGTTLMEIDGTAGAGITNGHDFVNLTGLGAAGALNYGGALTLDLGAIFATGTYSWNLFDMVSETGTFATISLADQYSGNLLDTDLNGVWDLTSGDNTWQFTESTGTLGLAVIPEPSAATLLGGMGILALLRRRRSNQSQLPQETHERLKCR